MAKKTVKKKPAAKKPAAKKTDPPRPVNTAGLTADPSNPREIGDRAAAGLATSMNEFGDISGIVFNRTTGQLVTGHQRISRIRDKWGELPIEELPGEKDHGVIRSPEGHVFAVRFVDWSKPKQRAANVSANSQRIGGMFTVDLDDYLDEIQADLAEESPSLFSDLLLDDIATLTTVGQQSEATGNQDPEESGDESLLFQVIVVCDDEDNQVELLDRFDKEGLKCRALIS